jgi:rubrerythrin
MSAPAAGDGVVTDSPAIVDDSGWDHPPPRGTVKLRCNECSLWFSSRGSETCPICEADPVKRKFRFVRKPVS